MSGWAKKRSVMRRYDLTAHIYDIRYAEEQAAKIKATLESLRIGGKSRILDVGCGTGILFDYITEEAETIVGLDISKKILIQAKKRAERFANAHLILADADNMPLKNRVFDFVFAITVLQNAPNPAVTLKEIRRAIVNSAKVVVTGMKKAFGLEDFERLLVETGLRIESLESEGLQCYVAVCSTK